jgi:parvulin-like peptidyl-prolyl isomerase
MIVNEEVQAEPLIAPAPAAEDAEPTLLAGAKPGERPTGGGGRPALLAIAFILVLGVGMYAGARINRMRAARPIAAVNNVTITRDDLFNGLQSLAVGGSAAGSVVMHNLVQQELQVQFAKKLGDAPTAEQVDQEYDKLSAKPGFDDAMRASMQNEAMIKRQILVQLSQANVLCKGLTVNDQEMRSYYAQQTNPSNPRAAFYKPDTVVLRLIVTANRSTADEAMQALESSNPFQIVAGTYSIAPNASKNGGLSNPILRGRSALSRDPALEQAVFNLGIGQQMGPIKVGNQWWIVRCVDKTPASTVPYDKVLDECRKGALLQKGLRINGPAVDAQFQKFEKASMLQSFWPQYDSVVQE